MQSEATVKPQPSLDLADEVTGLTALQRAMSTALADVDAELDRLLPRPDGPYARVQEAMRYAVFGGGKRLRPLLVLEGGGLFGAARAQALRVAAAIEMMHTYSLVHDDLPCMDDDDLRRGRATTHRHFDEATAVLAGDGLLTLAFEILAEKDTHASAEVRCELGVLLARAGGSLGMIGGQMMDIVAPARGFGREDIVQLQRLKTGALFSFACEAGAVLGCAAPEHRRAMAAYANDFGLAFQISDDLIDATGSAEKAGKAVGKDEGQGKATLVSIHGVSGARLEAERLVRSAVSALESYGAEADALRALPYSLLDRER